MKTRPGPRPRQQALSQSSMSSRIGTSLDGDSFPSEATPPPSRIYRDGIEIDRIDGPVTDPLEKSRQVLPSPQPRAAPGLSVRDSSQDDGGEASRPAEEVELPRGCWACEACTCINRKPHGLACEVCGTVRLGPIPVEPTPVQVFAVEVKSNPRGRSNKREKKGAAARKSAERARKSAEKTEEKKAAARRKAEAAEAEKVRRARERAHLKKQKADALAARREEKLVAKRLKEEVAEVKKELLKQTPDAVATEARKEEQRREKEEKAAAVAAKKELRKHLAKPGKGATREVRQSQRPPPKTPQRPSRRRSAPQDGTHPLAFSTPDPPLRESDFFRSTWTNDPTLTEAHEFDEPADLKQPISPGALPTGSQQSALHSGRQSSPSSPMPSTRTVPLKGSLNGGLQSEGRSSPAASTRTVTASPSASSVSASATGKDNWEL
mmetsp:Transcript_59877/g.135458  ORF Transcript_59877/g.135458 Transcript_59877/m.135458 type:complete len:437 (+) Transcript_59877:54-1364(+)